MRQFGQGVIRLLAGKNVHPTWAMSGGVDEPLCAVKRNKIKRKLPDAFDVIDLPLDRLKVQRIAGQQLTPERASKSSSNF